MAPECVAVRVRVHLAHASLGPHGYMTRILFLTPRTVRDIRGRDEADAEVREALSHCVWLGPLHYLSGGWALGDIRNGAPARREDATLRWKLQAGLPWRDG